ncbi:MAG: hypothetical protein JJU33_01115 [Phycisphaerales bacterium]|nr:hypothetical protein [Phycisphaerales bacterium]
MTDLSQPNPALRLVRPPSDAPRRPLLRVEEGRPAPRSKTAARAAEVAAENKAASTLSASDARWIFAVRVSELLDGGKAGVLTPDRRQRLLRLATNMGLRPFDANLIIAIVQDEARHGVSPSPLNTDTEQRLALVRPAEHARPSPWISIALAVLLAGLLFFALVGWVVG